MQVESKETNMNTVSHFPWFKALKRKLICSFPEIDAETLQVLRRNFFEELQKLLLEPNRSRARAFHGILCDFYLQFCWKVNWNGECHLKSTCVQILCCMNHVGLVLSKGDVFSVWFTRILIALKCFPGDPFIICDALLLIKSIKEKYHYAYAEILKSVLYDINMRKPPDAQCFMKAMLLFRRLKFLSHKNTAKEEVTLFASKIKCPADVESWLSSLNIQGLHNIKCGKVTQTLLKMKLKGVAVKKLLWVLFADKYDEKLIIGNKFNVKIQQKFADNKQIKKKPDKNHQQKTNKSREKPSKPEKKPLTLNNETAPELYGNSSMKCQEKIIVSDNTSEQYFVELQHEKGDKTSNQNDCEYFNSSVKHFDKKNCKYIPSLSESSTFQTRKSKKRTYLQTEDSVKTYLDNSSPLYMKQKKRKISNEGNFNLEEYNLEHSAIQKDDIHNIYTFEKLVADKINESTVECRNITSVVNDKLKNVAKENLRFVHNETLNQSACCISPLQDSQGNHVRNVPIVSRYMHKAENSANSFVSGKQHLFSVKTDHVNGCTKNSGYVSSEISFSIHEKDNVLNVPQIDSHCKNASRNSWLENSLITNSNKAQKNYIDSKVTSELYLLSGENDHISDQCHQIINDKNSKYNKIDIRNDNCTKNVTHNDSASSDGIYNKDRLLNVQRNVTKISCKYENISVNSENIGMSKADKPKICLSSDFDRAQKKLREHLEACVIENKEKENLDNDISTSEIQISESASENNPQLYKAENITNKEIRNIDTLAPSKLQNSAILHASPESLDLKITPAHSVSYLPVDLLERSKSIYTSSDSTAHFSLEDVSHADKKGMQDIFRQCDSKIATKKKSKFNNCRKKRRKKFRSRRFIEESNSSSEKLNVSNETLKIINNSNSVAAKLCDVQSAKFNSESSSKSDSFMSLSDENQTSDDSINHGKSSPSAILGKESKELVSESTRGLHNNQTPVEKQTENKLNRSFEGKDRESFSELQICKQFGIFKEVKIVLYDCLNNQNSSVRSSLKTVAQNLITPETDTSHSVYSTPKQRRCGKKMNRNFLSESDSDAFDDKKVLHNQNKSKSKLNDSLNSSKSSSLHLRPSNYKVKYKRCFLKSDNDASSDQNVSLNNSSASRNNSTNSSYSSRSRLQKTRSFSKVNPKDFILEFASEDNSDYDNSEYSSRCSSSPQSRSSNKVRPRNFILDSASEDNSDNDNSEYSSRSPSPDFRLSEKIKAKNFIVNSASEDNSDNDNSEYSSRSLSPDFRLPKKIKAKNFIVDSASEDNADNSKHSSRNSSPVLRTCNKLIVSNVNFDNFACDLRTSSPIKIKKSVTNCHNSKGSIVHSPMSSLDKEVTHSTESNSVSKNFDDSKGSLGSSPEEAKLVSVPELLNSEQTHMCKEVQVVLHDSLSIKNSSVSSSPNNLIQNSVLPETDTNILVHSKQKWKKSGERKTKRFVLESDSDSVDDQIVLHHQNAFKSTPDDSLNLCMSSPLQFKSSGNIKYKKCVVESDSEVSADQSILYNKSTAPHSNSVHLSKSSVQEINPKKITESASEDDKVQGILNESPSSVMKQKILPDLSKTVSNSFINQPSSDTDGLKNVLISVKRKQKCILRESSSESGSDSSENIPLLEVQKKLKNISNSSICFQDLVLGSNSIKSLQKNSVDCIQESRRVPNLAENLPFIPPLNSMKKQTGVIGLSETAEDSSINQPSSDINEQNNILIPVQKRKDHVLSETSVSILDVSEDIPLVEIREKLKSTFNSSMLSKDSVEVINASRSLLQNSINYMQECGKVSNSSESLLLSEISKKQKDNSDSLGVKQFENSVVDRDLEQFVINNSEDSISDKGKISNENLPFQSPVSPNVKQKSNFSLKLKNDILKNQPLLENDKNMCSSVISEKEKHLSNDSLLDSNYLSDEKFVQSYLDKIDSVIWTDEEYLNSFIDNYIISSSTHNSFNENIDVNNHQRSQDLNNSFKTVESTSNVSNIDGIHFRKENLRTGFKEKECNTLDIRNDNKNVCLNPSLEGKSQQLSNQCLNTCNNREPQQLDIDVEPEEVNFTQNCDNSVTHLQQNSVNVHNTDCFGQTSKYTQCKNNKTLDPLFHKLEFEIAAPEKVERTLNSEISLIKLQKNVSYISNANCSNQSPLNNLCAETSLNHEENLLANQLNLVNTPEINENILFLCDVEKKTCEVHMMPKNSLVSFLNKRENVSEMQTLCSSNTHCKCSVCNYLTCASVVCKNKEFLKGDTKENAGTQLEHIVVNGIKLPTASLLPVVNLGRRCDETIPIQNSITENKPTILSRSKLLEKKSPTAKGQYFLNSSSENMVTENYHRKEVLKTRRSTLCKGKNESGEVMNERNYVPQKSYSLRSRRRQKC